MSEKFTPQELNAMTPAEFRGIVRKGEWNNVTADACTNYGQANLIALPREYAFEFLLFCQRNPRPCYVLDVTEPGVPHPMLMAPEADLRTDLPRYRVFENGRIIDEPYDVTEYWRDDLVAFLIGCSWGFVWAFKAAKVPFRSLGDYTTDIELNSVGRFHGHMVCSCRAFHFPRRGACCPDNIAPYSVSRTAGSHRGPNPDRSKSYRQSRCVYSPLAHPAARAA